MHWICGQLGYQAQAWRLDALDAERRVREAVATKEEAQESASEAYARQMDVASWQLQL